MRSYLELITRWETFLHQSPQGSITDFANWLIKNEPTASPQTAQKNDLENYFDGKTAEFSYSEANSEAAYLIWRLHKFVKRYTKSVFLTLGINNQDEFAILAHVDYLKECSKKMAIEENLIEMSSGIDMITRLVKHDWLAERPNPKDKREKLIRLTEKGQTLLYAVYEGFKTVPDILVEMSEEERQILLVQLKKLDNFHTNASPPVSTP